MSRLICPPALPPWLGIGPSSCSRSISSLSGCGSRLVIVGLLSKPTAEEPCVFHRLRQAERGELPDEPAGQHIAGQLAFAQVLGRILLLEIAAALVRPHGAGVHQAQPRLEAD